MSASKKIKISRFSASKEELIGPNGKSNLWTLSAREDIYNRRQNGEDWEKICKDYPNRTRHAMQQQYSVMKKQSDIDSGSFTPSKRGGRRNRGAKRGPRGSGWTTVQKMRETSDEDDDPEYDGLSSLSASDYERDDDAGEITPAVEEDGEFSANGATKSQPGPQALQRSKTEPSTRGRKRSLFPNLPKSTAIDVEDKMDVQPNVADPQVLSNSPVSQVSAANTVKPASKPKADPTNSTSPSRSSSRLSKKRRSSTEPSEVTTGTPTVPSNSSKIIQESFGSGGMLFLPEDIARAQARLSKLGIAYEAEKAAQKTTYEAANKRYTRRANEAEYKVHEISRENGLRLKAKDEEHAKEISTLKESLKAEQDRTKALTTELGEAKVSRASSTNNEAIESLQSQIAALNTDLKLYDNLRLSISNEVAKVQSLQRAASEKAEQFKVQHTILTTAITKLTGLDLGDVGPKTTDRHRQDVKAQNEVLEEGVQDVGGAWKAVAEAVENFKAQFDGAVHDKGGSADIDMAT